MIMNYKGFVPDVNGAAFVAENAAVIGRVQMGQGSSVWFGAVLRGDDEKIAVGKNSNIQDNCTVHCTPGFPTVIGDNVSVGHNAVLHGCTIGNGSLIGMSATVMNGAVIGKNCLVGAGALVTENKHFPDNSLIIGVPAKAVGTIDSQAAAKIMQNAVHYSEKASEFALQTKLLEKKENI